MDFSDSNEIMNPSKQLEWIHDFNKKTRIPFEDNLFERNEYEIVDSLKKILMSCQRDRFFTIKILGFDVIESYQEIQKILYNYEQSKIDKNQNKKHENKYNYINLKDSSIMLLVIHYYIAVNNPEAPEEDTFDVIVEIPRLVNKYYYRIGGNLFSAIYQILESSTYNNTSSKSKKQSVTFKPIFMPVRIYRNPAEGFDMNKNRVKYVKYSSSIFSKNVLVVEYFFAKYGLYGGIEFLGLKGLIDITDCEPVQEVQDECYCFHTGPLYVSVPKMLFDQDLVLQCTVMTIVGHFDRYKSAISLPIIKKTEYWLEYLSIKYNSKPSVEKGLSILDSLESIYDADTKDCLRLPDYDKADIYCILRWLIREFQGLRLKDNADIATKKIRIGPYCASYYVAKVSRGIYLASDTQKKITCKDLRRYLDIHPEYLIDHIIKDKLVSFRNNVNDDDAFTALKYSFKGVSGLGEQKGSTIPDSYRRLHYSSYGRLDPDSSSATDPGLTGILCPMAQIYNSGFAPKEYTEPNGWHEEFSELVDRYHETIGRRNIIKLYSELPDIFSIADTNKMREDIDVIESCLETQRVALSSFAETDNTSKYLASSYDEDGNLVIFEDEDVD